MKEIGSNRQNAFNSRAHQRRGDDESAAGSDTTGDKTGPEPDEDRHDEYSQRIKRRAVCLFASRYIRERISHLIRESDAAQNNWNNQQAEHRQLLFIPQDGINDAQCLSKKGLNIAKVFNGQEALEKLENDLNIEVVVLDVKMPGVDGLQTLAEIELKNGQSRA
jgi:hypothetical protein